MKFSTRIALMILIILFPAMLNVYFGYQNINFSDNSFYESINNSNNSIFILSVITTLISLIIGAIIVLVNIKIIANPLSKLIDFSNKISNRDFSNKETIKGANEFEKLNKGFNNIVDDYQEITETCLKIANGDYSIKLPTKSKNDKLADSINLMSATLKDNKAKVDEQIWLRENRDQLHEQIIGDLTLENISQNIINYLSQLFEAKIGSLYLIEKDKLILRSGFAFSMDSILKEVKLGEGIIGQVAQTNKQIVLESIPDDYIKIKSSIGETKPNYIYVTPISLNNKLVAVLEFGVLTKFSSKYNIFLKLIEESLAISLLSAQSRLEFGKLFDKTQKQTNILKAQAEELANKNEELEQQTFALRKSELTLQEQQEELQQSNEELQAQAKALKESELSLQNQQEELRVTNEELEDKNIALQHQRDDIKVKNIELTEIRNEIEQKATDLERTSKYKSEFLANMSHELRTPLNSILVLSQLLAKNKTLEEKQKKFANTINSSGKDLLELINDILDLSKVESGTMELKIDSFDIGELSEEIEHKYGIIANDKKLDFEIEYSDKLPKEIQSDRTRLLQVLKNLIFNAIKYTEKGKVSVKILPRENNMLVFEIHDTGIGIPSDKKKLVFEAFKQVDGSTSRRFGGTGLGLSISKNLSKLLQGSIELESEEGKGSIFSFIMPIAIDTNKIDNDVEIKFSPSKNVEIKEFKDQNVHLTYKEENITEPDNLPKFLINTDDTEFENTLVSDDRKDISPNDKTLLIIEDDINFAQILHDLAKDRDFKVIMARNGETGLHYAEFYKPQAIILDIGLPGISGWEVMDRLKSNHATRRIPVHFMSANDRSIEAMKQGAIGFVSKPASVESIQEAFSTIEEKITHTIKNILVIEDNEAMRESIIGLLENQDVNIQAVASGNEGCNILFNEKIDCVILDLGLEDMTGFEMIEKIRQNKSVSNVPIIIYTGKDLTKKENEILEKYASSIIIKGAQSPERLVSETTLFLHSVENEINKNSSEKKRKNNSLTTLTGRKVLVVDDDMRNVFALTSVLEDEKMKISVGNNGKEGIEVLEKEDNIDIVLMDIMMPEMNGYEAMTEIRKNKKFEKLPIIALTAKAMKGDKEKCMAAGANDYLTKPIDSDKLISLLKVWLYN